MSVMNGSRLEVAFGDFRGVAGVVERGALRLVSYRAKLPPRVGDVGEIAGAPYRVIAAAVSRHTKGMVTLTAEPAAEADPS